MFYQIKIIMCMKSFRILFFPALIAACLSSCSKTADLSSTRETPSGTIIEEIDHLGTLHVTVGTGTKASLTQAEEKAVNSLQVFVFNAQTGKRETDKFVNGSSLQITAPLGEKHLWAVVNHERFMDMKTEDELKATVSDLSDNCSGNAISLVMAGSKNLTVEQKEMNVEVEVTRLVSRIYLKDVTLDFADTYLKDCTFTIKDIYLKNVAGNTNFSLDKKNATEWDIIDPTAWYNKMKFEDTPKVNPLISDRGLSIVCPEREKKSINKVWFCYPNPTAGDSNSTDWSARKTRLVIHAEVVGYGSSAIQSYYTFTLPVLKRNYSYEISNITFSMLGKGNDDDDTVTDTGVASISLNVAEWDSGTAITYNM